MVKGKFYRMLAGMATYSPKPWSWIGKAASEEITCGGKNRWPSWGISSMAQFFGIKELIHAPVSWDQTARITAPWLTITNSSLGYRLRRSSEFRHHALADVFIAFAARRPPKPLALRVVTGINGSQGSMLTPRLPLQ